MHPDDYTVLPIPPLPRSQCLEETTFCQPPLDGTLTIPEIYDWHLVHSPHHPVLVYSDDNSEQKTICWSECVRAVHRAGHLVTALAEKDDARRPVRQVFAVISATDTITYFTLIEGIIRAGHVVFPISPRNSAQAVAHLLSKTDAGQVFVGPETSMKDLAAAALEILRDSGGRVPSVAGIPTFEDLYPMDSAENFEPLPSFKPDWNDPVIYMHSSGSTAFPKPILWTHYRYFLLSVYPYLGERNLTGKRFSCHSMPMHHGMGMTQTGWTATAGVVVTSFKPQSPAIIPTPDLVIKGSVATKADVIFCVPSFIEAWARNPDHVDILRRVDGILYGGGHLSQSVGDVLSDEGISIFMMYGCSECGNMSTILPEEASKRDWNYFKFPDGVETRFIWDDHGNAEALILPGKFLVPCVFNTVIDGVDAYATNDLLTPHPTKPGHWRIFGRADDQIIHSRGEKTNPAPLESILNQDPYIQAAIIFGRGEYSLGVLVDPPTAHAIDPDDEEKLQEFRDKIWYLSRNLHSCQASSLHIQMILVVKPSKPFAYTVKNTARRQAIINEYESEIDALYARVAGTDRECQ
ncbi:acetyl-CoA synthetase-like protein [Panus rudis PR-1116 ss-1]|nr:acetyl-CoA synthetase-like protein [Panus rudis PR-1116 ss-1]